MILHLILPWSTVLINNNAYAFIFFQNAAGSAEKIKTAVIEVLGSMKVKKVDEIIENIVDYKYTVRSDNTETMYDIELPTNMEAITPHLKTIANAKSKDLAEMEEDYLAWAYYLLKHVTEQRKELQLGDIM